MESIGLRLSGGYQVSHTSIASRSAELERISLQVTPGVLVLEGCDGLQSRRLSVHSG